MIITDLNLLVYAVNEDAPSHDRAKPWLEECLSGDETVGLPWVVVLGFLRITTHARVLPRPLRAEQALAVIDGWIARPVVSLVEPTERHWPLLRELLEELGTAGSLTTDVHLAALAIEHGALLCSADRDFGRFRNLRWSNPLA
ncbi:MAG: ribonuclease VapC37 [Myxococcales bacterium]